MASARSDMVRFYWRADVQKKAKIMRKVKFPMELDVSELVSLHYTRLTRVPILILLTSGSSRTNYVNKSARSTWR